MKVSGFTFVRNAIKYDYPVVEAILSILPLCDEVVVAVGKSEDDTLGLIQGINSPKIKIIETVWDDSLREGGHVLAVETNKAFAAVSEDADWAFYIQGDEVLHEQYLDAVREAMQKYKDAPEVDGLLLKYRHFYGSYDYVGDSLRWYRREIRVVRKRKDIYSFRDAQGFRKGDNHKLNVKLVDAYMHHYGWVKEPKAMQGKHESFGKLWHSDEQLEKIVVKAEEFDYSGIDALRLYEGSHPKVMQERIERLNWKFNHDLSKNHLKLKDRIKLFVEKITGKRLGEYRNYKII
ncbi:glycosyltransferase family 2 protein [Pontibacter harenae]|uniref:glycosyltransferase family 2 protein n=1 Tax=Pontibacter harenae TaxID=2894083 RepID=UPI001E4EC805|nr:glycosyltransferase family 2 protein [Pontibacter harenae]MCC9166825.1 glycosyltransferase family 2 protein [Pontibacter harenae]